MYSNVKTKLIRIPLILALFILGLNIAPVSVYANSVNGQDENQIASVINEYFLLRYQELKTLSSPDYSSLIDANRPASESWRSKEANIFAIKTTIAKIFGITVQDTSFSLKFLSIKVVDNVATVNLLESSKIFYSSDPTDPAILGGLEHTITLAKEYGRWMIQLDQYEDDMTRLVESTSMDEIYKNIQTNHDLMVKSGMTRTAPVNASYVLKPMLLSTYTYSNSAATSYSNSYALSTGAVPSAVRNSSGWDSSYPTSYKVYSDDDCTNFVSQAIFAGTSSTDSDANYFYPDSNHYSDWWYYKFSNTVDGSQPWVRVGNLYSFLTSNSSRGPYGSAVAYCDSRLNSGDPIFMQAGGSWAHAVIIASGTGCTNVKVNAHTTNYYHQDLSYYSGYSMYPVNMLYYYK